jgi:hypothetical protein
VRFNLTEEKMKPLQVAELVKVLYEQKIKSHVYLQIQLPDGRRLPVSDISTEITTCKDIPSCLVLEASEECKVCEEG